MGQDLDESLVLYYDTYVLGQVYPETGLKHQGFILEINFKMGPFAIKQQAKGGLSSLSFVVCLHGFHQCKLLTKFRGSISSTSLERYNMHC